jgi:hypothetical protein
MPDQQVQPDARRTFNQSKENRTTCGPFGVDSQAKLAVAVAFSTVLCFCATRAFRLFVL